MLTGTAIRTSAGWGAAVFLGYQIRVHLEKTARFSLPSRHQAHVLSLTPPVPSVSLVLSSFYMSRLSFITTFGLLASQSASGAVTRRFDSVEPFYQHDAADCNLWWNSDDGLSCDTVLLIAGISIGELIRLNPSVSSCSDWLSDRSYCINNAAGPPAVTSSAIVGPTSTISRTITIIIAVAGNGVATPAPVQPGIVHNCNSFYLVQSGDTGSNIASRNGVTVAQLATWNTGIGGASCTGMWAGYYLCTGVIGSTKTQPPPASTTPTPIQNGVVGNCKTIHFVESGQNCEIIAAKYSITVANFISWNPAAGSSCTGLWSNTYACVGL